MIIDRNIINKDLFINDMNQEEFFILINRFKHMLLQSGVRKGEVTTIVIPKAGPLQFAAMFACLELGLPLWQNSEALWDMDDKTIEFIDNMSPENKSKLPVNRIAFFTERSIEFHKKFFNNWDLYWNKLIISCRNYLRVQDLPNEYDDIHPWSVDETDTAFIQSQNFWKQEVNPFTYISHKESIEHSLPFVETHRNKRVGITMSYHHYSAWERNILPAFMSSKVILPLTIISPDLYGHRTATQFFTKRDMSKLLAVDIMYSAESDAMEMVFKTMSKLEKDFSTPLTVILHDNQDAISTKLNVNYLK